MTEFKPEQPKPTKPLGNPLNPEMGVTDETLRKYLSFRGFWRERVFITMEYEMRSIVPSLPHEGYPYSSDVIDAWKKRRSEEYGKLIQQHKSKGYMAETDAEFLSNSRKELEHIARHPKVSRLELPHGSLTVHTKPLEFTLRHSSRDRGSVYQLGSFRIHIDAQERRISVGGDTQLDSKKDIGYRDAEPIRIFHPNVYRGEPMLKDKGREIYEHLKLGHIGQLFDGMMEFLQGSSNIECISLEMLNKYRITPDQRP